MYYCVGLFFFCLCHTHHGVWSDIDLFDRISIGHMIWHYGFSYLSVQLCTIIVLTLFYLYIIYIIGNLRYLSYLSSLTYHYNIHPCHLLES